MITDNLLILNKEKINLSKIEPNYILLDWLREEKGLTGSKEGCAEGDCGACSILISPINGGVPKPANACLLKLGQLAGSEIITVEGLGNLQKPHPVQKAMYESGGSQCGFCTPGFVIALTGLYNKNSNPSENDIHDALAGNLCRCTGYKPIIEAAKNLNNSKISINESDAWIKSDIYRGKTSNFFYPKTIKEALKFSSVNENIKYLSGGTDLNLQIKDLYSKINFIQLSRIKELTKFYVKDRELIIGAACTLEDLLPLFDQKLKPFAEIIRRFGSTQIRSQATMSGNLCTASPIGDIAPSLMALGSTVKIASNSGDKFIAVEDLFADYRKTVLGPNDILSYINIPLLEKETEFFSWKISKRYDQDITTVSMSATVNCNSIGLIKSCKICFGGLASIPIRTKRIEDSMIGKLPNEDLENKLDIVRKEFNPLSDLRGSAEYRKNVAIGLIKRLIHSILFKDNNIEVMKIEDVN